MHMSACGGVSEKGQFMKSRICALQVVLVCLLAGCMSRDAGRDVGPTSYVATPHGRRPIESSLKRTTAEKWRVHEFSNTGCKVDVPVDAYRVHEDLRGHASVYLHPIAPPGIMDDVQCMVWIEFRRLSEESFKAQAEEMLQSGVYARADEQGRQLLEWDRGRRHPEFSRWDRNPYTYFRCDASCQDGSLISMHAEVLNIFKNGKSLYIDEDERLIRRIMESVQCLKSGE